MSQGIETIYGTAGVGREESWLDQALQTLQSHGIKKLDTAQLYPNSEKTLGVHGAPEKFTIDTKLPGAFVPGTAAGDKILGHATTSLEALKTKQVDVYYIHAPDKNIPFGETLQGIQEVYEKGMFKRFGLSNYKAEDVEAVYKICEEKGWVKPSVYQGNYSAIARRQETELFPTLRELGISFYAYSPLAGGFLTKTPQQIKDGAGRFDPSTPIGSMYAGMYNKESYVAILAEWEAIAKDAGCSRAELAYRWVKYNSPLKPEYGDGIIVGASRLEQLEQTLKGLEAGPLPESAVKAIDGIWEKIMHDAPLDNHHR